MKKVLIISLFFPPCNLPASQRAFSWANYLHKFGYYPIILTRRWDHHLTHLSDASRDTESTVLHEKNEHYEVYYLPYKGNLRDRLYVKYGNERYRFIRKILTFMELLFQNFYSVFIPYKNIYSQARRLLKNSSDIQKVIITGNPFNTFKFGYDLKMEFNIKWIADYRDAWTTSEINHQNGFFFRIIKWIDVLFEKKWVRSASIVTASSKPIAEGISDLTGTKSAELFNGFVASDFSHVEGVNKYKQFTISYIGTLYEGQRAEIFCDAFKSFIDEQLQKPNVKLFFPGLSFYSEKESRIKRILKGYEEYYECTMRMDRKKILEIERSSHLLLHVGWNEKGIIASKIYEYLASGTRILVVPSDHSSIEEIIKTSKAGTCISEVSLVKDFLQKEYDDYMQGMVKINDVNSEEIQQFSREKQVERLAKILYEL